MSIKMKELPISERPYEKMEMYGESILSNAELLAIIIKSGTKEESSVALAQKILSLGKEYSKDTLSFLQDITIEELTKINGIGKVKALQIKAVCELAKRISRPIDNQKIKIKSPQDIVNLVMNELKLEKREIVKVVVLNSQNVIIKIQTIALGKTNSANIDIKDIFTEAIKRGLNKIILLHNHPSGNSIPSKQDIDFTKRIEEAGNLLNIQLLDHIIIGYNEYTSIKSYLLKKGRTI